MKLALGTVQFGMNYGISNAVGQVSPEEIKKILKLAADNHIDLLDTAAAYGESEAVLGECLTDSNHFKLISKLPAFKNSNFIQADIGLINQGFQESLRKLNTNHLYGLLLHNADDLLKPGAEFVYQYLLDLKNQGLVKKIGVSVYYPEQVEKLLKIYQFDLVQLPMNLFDQRFYRQGILEKLKDSNIEIHVRSVLLQGLLMMPIAQIPEKLSAAKPYLKNLDQLVFENFLDSRLSLLLEFIKQTQQVDYAILGVTSAEELKLLIEALDFFKSENKEKINWEKFSIEDENLIIPARWS